MGLYRRGKFFWFSLTYQGNRIQESLKTDKKALAEKLYAKILTEIIEGRYFDAVKAKSITFREMAKKYLQKYEKQRDSYTFKRLNPYFGDMKLSEITTEAIEDYILERAEEGAKPATIYQEFAFGRRMFNVARKKWKWISINPFADVTFSELLKIDNKRDQWLTPDEETVLLNAATPEYLKDVITFAIHTGCRRGEILLASWRENIDMKRQVVVITASKGGSRKSIPMSQTLYTMLYKRSKVKHISGKVFPVQMLAVKDAFERAVEKAGLGDFHFQDLRHTFATRLVQAGVDLYAIQKLMGHKSIRMTERYAHHYPESLRPSVRALDDCYNSATIGERSTCSQARKTFRINHGSA